MKNDFFCFVWEITNPLEKINTADTLIDFGIWLEYKLKEKDVNQPRSLSKFYSWQNKQEGEADGNAIGGPPPSTRGADELTHIKRTHAYTHASLFMAA